jgi:glc operon protein GlcG
MYGIDRMTRMLLATVVAAGIAAPAAAQVAERTTLTIDGARAVVRAAVMEARAKNAPGAVAVVDDGGNLMALERLDGTFAAGASISIGKARTAALFKRPTAFFEDVIRKGRTPMVALDDFTPLQGGVPIMVNGQIVGAVGVSGAASAQQDEDLALAGAAALASNGDEATEARVGYWPSAEVTAAFAKGAVLYDGRGRNYMVHASHRDKPGLAEVHTLDTDIIYVLAGSATFVTGGTVDAGKTVEANEIRGASIRGGDTRELGPGDVVIVPAGTPHWFKDVKGPFNYYVVKVQ